MKKPSCERVRCHHERLFLAHNAPARARPRRELLREPTGISLLCGFKLHIWKNGRLSYVSLRCVDTRSRLPLDIYALCFLSPSAWRIPQVAPILPQPLHTPFDIRFSLLSLELISLPRPNFVNLLTALSIRHIHSSAAWTFPRSHRMPHTLPIYVIQRVSKYISLHVTHSPVCLPKCRMPCP